MDMRNLGPLSFSFVLCKRQVEMLPEYKSERIFINLLSGNRFHPHHYSMTRLVLFCLIPLITANTYWASQACCPPQVWRSVLVFQFHDGLHSSVVVIEVDGPHHLGAFQIPDFHRYFADGVAANELHNLLGGGVSRVHFNGRQLDVLHTRGHIER